MKKYKNQVEENEGFRQQRNETGRDLGDREAFARGVAISKLNPIRSPTIWSSNRRPTLEIDGQRARDVLQLKKADWARNQPHRRVGR
jgi:hypothetical protein